MEDIINKDTQSHDKKNKSGFASFKKKLNIPKIYKRLASKLSIHGRHFRSLTSSWTASDLQCLVLQYELSEMLKELSDAADLARSLPRNTSEDLLQMQSENFLCDLTLLCRNSSDRTDVVSKGTQVHSSLFSKRLNIVLSSGENSFVRRSRSEQPLTTLQRSVSTKSTLDIILQELSKTVPSDITYTYDQDAKSLTFSSDHYLSQDFLTSLLNYVYGRKVKTMKSTAGSVLSDKDGLTFVPEEDVAYRSLSSPSKTNDESTSLFLKSNQQPSDKKYADEFRNDMKDFLLSANVTGDLKLIFVVSTSAFSTRSRSRQPSLCFHCHSFVLSARSKFFRNMIQRHRLRVDNNSIDGSHFTTIELDRKVLSPRYFFVVIYAMYTDELDLQRVIKNIPILTPRVSFESLSDEVRDLMELFHIGKFLDFYGLVQACENALLEHLSVNNLIEILQWSSQGCGSPWLRRQIMRFSKENFQQLLTNGVLYSLPLSDLKEIVSSDFVNSPELDILRAVLKWGEHELLRRIELREPNLVRSHILLNQTSRNFRVSPARRRELVMAGNSEELHDITASLLTYVRLRHVLPANHEVVNSAIKRGVISCPPEHLLEWHHHGGLDDSGNSCFWIRCKAGPEFSQPRLFTPYLTEAKTLLKERLLQEAADAVPKSSRRINQANRPTPSPFVNSPVPDALYMVSEGRHLSRQSSVRNSYCDKCQRLRVGVTSMATKRLKYIDNRYPVPTPSKASQLLARERSLRQSSWVRRVLHASHSSSLSSSHCCCPSVRNSLTETNPNIQNPNICSLCRAEAYVRLIVVREHDLPDITADILKRPHVYYDADDLLAASREVASIDDDVRPFNPTRTSPSAIESIPPKRLEKLLRKKTLAINKHYEPAITSASVWKSSDQANDSSSDLSFSDDSSTEWPFPYRSGQMRDRTQPGSSFWDSDSSIKTPPLRTVVPDVAASADSTLQSLRRTRLTSSSSSDSCSSVTCRLVAESRPPDNDESDDASRRFYTGAYHSFSALRKSSAPSYAHYLSLRKPIAGKRRPALAEFHGFTRTTVDNSSHSKTLKESEMQANNLEIETSVKSPSFPSVAVQLKPSLTVAPSFSTTYNDLSNLPETYT